MFEFVAPDVDACACVYPEFHSHLRRTNTLPTLTGKSTRSLRRRKVRSEMLRSNASLSEEFAIMESDTIDPAMTIDEIMRRWPATIRVMIENHLLCIGCPIGIFHTVADVCAAHSLDERVFSLQLLAAMHSDRTANESSAFIPVEGAA